MNLFCDFAFHIVAIGLFMADTKLEANQSHKRFPIAA
jgi:hypothetical protein